MNDSQAKPTDPDIVTNDEEMAEYHLAHEMARTALMALRPFGAVSGAVALNVLASMTYSVLTSFEYENPHDVLVEFDSFAAFTRARVADHIKGKLS